VTAADPEAPNRRALVADLRLRIDRRHMRPGDTFRGGVVLHEVPSVEGTRADSLALDFRHGKPALVGYEIKVARSDWLHELDNPAKAEAWARHCTEWYVAAPSGVVHPDELPDGWGLVTPVAKVRLTVTRAARPRPAADLALPLPVVIELAKKLDTQRVHEVTEATDRLRRRVAELEHADRVAHAQDSALVEDGALFRRLLTRCGIDRERFSRWTFDRGGSTEEELLTTALDGAHAVLRARERAQRDVDSARRTLTDALARLSGTDPLEHP
jgi:hypothetical protein